MAKFQSTHPVRGATPLQHVLDADGLISIHAPREGCDTTVEVAELLNVFQSTHPVRGATYDHKIVHDWELNFNPRTP